MQPKGGCTLPSDPTFIIIANTNIIIERSMDLRAHTFGLWDLNNIMHSRTKEMVL